MAKTKTKSNSNLLRRMGRNQLLVVVAFVLVFVGFGSWFVLRSEAASCLGTTLKVGSSGWCVSVLQDSMGVMADRYGSQRVFPPDVDGSYGPQTQLSVSMYQHNILGQARPSGTIISIYSGGQTWIPLCVDLRNQYNYAIKAGLTYWRNRASTDFSWLGCSAYVGSI